MKWSSNLPEPAPETLCVCGCAYRNHHTPTFSYSGAMACLFDHSKLCRKLHVFTPKGEGQ